MTAFHFYTALAVAKQSAWLSAKRKNAGDPHPLHRTHCCSDFFIFKGEHFIDERKAKE